MGLNFGIITAEVIVNFRDQEANFLSNIKDYIPTGIYTVNHGSSSESYLAKLRQDNPKIQFLPVKNHEEAYEKFSTREADGMIADRTILKKLYDFTKQDNIKVIIHPEQLSQEYYGIAINKNIPRELQAKINPRRARFIKYGKRMVPHQRS